VEKPDLASTSMEDLEGWVRAKYELGSFKPGGDGFLPHVRVKSTSCVGMVEFVGLLFIRLVEASELPPTDFGKTDAFCEFQVRVHRPSTPTLTPPRRSRVPFSTNALSRRCCGLRCSWGTARAAQRRSRGRATRDGVSRSRSTPSRFPRR